MRIAQAIAAAAVLAPLAACNPHITIDQTKPVEININVAARLDLVIHDARQDMEAITGEKPANTVRPEDIGLPAVKSSGSAIAPAPRYLVDNAVAEEPLVPVLLRTGGGPEARERLYTAATTDEIKKSLAARDSQIRALWGSGAIGESHDGTVVARQTLTAEQQKLVTAENADRQALYAAEAAAKKQSVNDVVLGYYLARLGYAKKGAWYEKANSKGGWDWVQWDR
jgi:uncharacterized protein YdbL (DUF1318 family)